MLRKLAAAAALTVAAASMLQVRAADVARPVELPDGGLAAGAALPERPKCELTWPLPSLITPLSWVDHQFPTRQQDGVMLRYDGNQDANYDGHRGLDLPVPQRTAVLAADDGVVTYAAWDDAGGFGVGIHHGGCRTFYFHNSTLLVEVGRHVSRGQVIALSGTTGNSTGPHVHFEVRDLGHRWHSIDPYGWTAAGPDPWPWDQGVLWRGGRPSPVAIQPAGAAPAHQPSIDLVAEPPRAPEELQRGAPPGTSLTADGTVGLAGQTGLKVPVEGQALRLQACASSVCVLDRRGNVFAVAGGRVTRRFTLPLGRRAADFGCVADGACVVLDIYGEVYAVPRADGAPAPDLSSMPGPWPLGGAPASLILSPAATGANLAGWLVDDAGGSRSFGPALLNIPDPTDPLREHVFS
jgi:hypothetical protein